MASDRIGALSSQRAGEVIAAGWPTAWTQVVPVGEAGRGFVEAYADASGGQSETTTKPTGVATVVTGAAGSALAWEPSTASTGAALYDATSWDWGRALRRVLEERPSTVYVDLAGPAVHDAGAGALAAMGALGDRPLDRGAAPLSELTELDLAPALDLVEGVDLVGVVPEAELSALLLGLRGITSRRGRERDEDTGRMLAVDAALERFAALTAHERSNAPGSGACGGLGFAVLALNGRLVTGPSVTLDTATVGDRPDLVVTGCSVFDFARRGGGVVAEAARLAGEALAPCIVLAGETYIGAREMRAMGIEAAYAVRRESTLGAVDQSWSPTESELAQLGARVSRSWRW